MFAHMSTDRAVLERLSAGTTLPVVSLIAVRVAYLFYLWAHRSRTRRHLRQLPDNLLFDLGLTRRDARLEGSKWFWRP